MKEVYLLKYKEKDIKVYEVKDSHAMPIFNDIGVAYIACDNDNDLSPPMDTVFESLYVAINAIQNK